MKRPKQNDTILTESRRDLLASCLVIISAFVLMFSWTAIIAKSFVWLFVTLGVYVLILWGMILLFTGRSKSEGLLLIMSLIGIVGAVGSAFLVWAVFNLQI